MLSRRRLLQGSAAALSAGTATGVYMWRVEPHWLDVTHKLLPIKGLPA